MTTRRLIGSDSLSLFHGDSLVTVDGLLRLEAAGEVAHKLRCHPQTVRNLTVFDAPRPDELPPVGMCLIGEKTVYLWSPVTTTRVYHERLCRREGRRPERQMPLFFGPRAV